MNNQVLHKDIVEVCKTIYDPEIPQNIWDLGLVYSIDIENRNEINGDARDVLDKGKSIEENGKSFLNVDNFSGHVPDHKNDTVKIQYLPPNSTSKDQVCDQGVIRSLQVYYKYSLLNILADYEQGSLPGLFKAPKLRPDPIILLLLIITKMKKI